MQALILVGGLGTRLRAVLGPALPKPMAPVGGPPFLAYLLGQLRRHGLGEVWLLTGFGAASVEGYFGTGDGWDLTIGYSVEPEPLGTGGALRHVLPRLSGERFLVMNGDSFLGAPLDLLVRAHERARAATPATLASLALARVDDARRFGSVERAPDGRVTGFREKTPPAGFAAPASSTVDPDAKAAAALINAGVYVVERALIESLAPRGPVSLERDVFPTLTDGRLHGVELAGPFMDIGLPESYAAICADHAMLLPMLEPLPMPGPV
jgi:NDP-sugar pyrophosphorylase family protein